MTLKQALRILKRFNKWRRGADTKMLEPKKIGLALDVVINELDKRGM